MSTPDGRGPGGGAGTSSGRPQSAVLVPVPEAEPAVGAWRRRYDPVAAAGVPAHITLVVPWLAPGEIAPADLAALGAVVADAKAFDFSLTAVGWFDRQVLWLAPDPAEPFRALTDAVAERFDTPPWAGQFEEVVPHLTVAHGGDGVDLEGIAAALHAELPLPCRARQVWVMVGDGSRWSVRHQLALAG